MRVCGVRLVCGGEGAEYGVTEVGGECRACASNDPRDRRTRSAVLIESGGRRLLIDTPPELRLQLVAAGVGGVDAVLFTHAHADHAHGIDYLRAISVRRRAPVEVYGAAGTLAGLRRRFHYIFPPT